MSLRRGLLALTTLCAALALGLAVTAYAYLTGGGSGRGGASLATLPAPAITRAAAGSAAVALQWSAVAAPGSGTVAYSVTRDGGAPAGDCPTVASPRAVLSCTDTGVSLASHTYVVTAHWRSWTGVSARQSVTVTHGPVTQLVVTTQPGGGATGGSAFPNQPVVTARDAAGNVVADYSGTVSLTIKSGTGTSGAVLSGCTGTLTDGVTRFTGCAIDRSGSNYQLRASDGTRTVDTSSFNVSVGAASQLVFTTQPGNGRGGSELSPQPVVTARDAGGNTVTGYTGTVTLSIAPGTGAPDATLGNCSGSRVNGVTTFDNCEIDRAATGYRLRASDNRGLPASDSNAFNVTVGSLDDIVFSTSPAGAVSDTPFTTQPVVTAVDAGGNTVTSYTSTVTLSIRSGTGADDAVLSGCRGTRVNGVVTFAGCQIDLADPGYRLRATDSGFRSADSDTFAVVAGPLARLAFTTQPSTSTAGRALATAPVVTGADAAGNPVAGYSGTITLSVTRDPSVLSGCTPAVRSGATTFSNCSISRSGSGYVLHASDGTLSGDSSSFTVNAGSATQLQFTTQPAGAIRGAAFTTQPVVTAFDSLGNVATSYTGTVSLAIKSGTGTSGASLSSCSGNRVNGVVTFSGCRIDRFGTGYQLRASDGTRTADSAAFDVVTGRAVGFLLQAATTSPTAGAANALRITARDAGGNTDTTYTGSHDLRFDGANTSPSGSVATVTNSAGTAIAFGATTSIRFVDGVATVTSGANGAMVLRDAGSDSVGVTDGTISEEDELDVTVAPGAAARLAWTDVDQSAGSLSTPCLFTCTNSNVNSGSTFNANVSVTDADGNTVSNIGSGHTVRLSVTSAGGSFTSPSSGSSVTLSFPSTGVADSTSEFTFRTQTSGSWTTNSFRADTLAGTVYTTATASMVN